MDEIYDDIETILCFYFYYSLVDKTFNIRTKLIDSFDHLLVPQHIHNIQAIFEDSHIPLAKFI